MGFQIVFNILKIKKKTCQQIGQIHFCQQLEKEVFKKCFWQNHRDTYGASFNTPKSTH